MMNFGKIVCDDWSWMKLAEDPFQWQALVQTLLQRRVLLSKSCLIIGNGRH
jgi:hypothetical protein